MYSIPIVLYPGDNWSGDKKIDNSIAIKNYEMDLQKKIELHTDSNIVEYDKLKNLAFSYINNIKNLNAALLPLKHLQR